MDFKVKKLRRLVLFLDSYEKQGFIDTPATVDFDKKVRNWLVSAGLACFSGPPGEMWIRGCPEEVVGEFKAILLEILGGTIEDVWKWAIESSKPREERVEELTEWAKNCIRRGCSNIFGKLYDEAEERWSQYVTRHELSEVVKETFKKLKKG